MLTWVPVIISLFAACVSVYSVRLTKRNFENTQEANQKNEKRLSKERILMANFGVRQSAYAKVYSELYTYKSFIENKKYGYMKVPG
ncbi:hypothetical protein [Paenibacillus campi]|uniref:hypothetical protein n=1 Tax=Paenibacillus campi TaxID=3106031 RepID=UPI002AFEEB9C|nr:hypothetical protein [Paenibacillus sp. SGZ-1009]